MSRRDAEQLVRDLTSYFREANSRYSVIQRGNHWHIVTPKGASVASFALTPSDHRFRQNTISKLRRRGIIPHDWRG